MNKQEIITKFKEDMLSGYASIIHAKALLAACGYLDFALDSHAEEVRKEQIEKDQIKIDKAFMSGQHLAGYYVSFDEKKPLWIIQLFGEATEDKLKGIEKKIKEIREEELNQPTK